MLLESHAFSSPAAYLLPGKVVAPWSSTDFQWNQISALKTGSEFSYEPRTDLAWPVSLSPRCLAEQRVYSPVSPPGCSSKQPLALWSQRTQQRFGGYNSYLSPPLSAGLTLPTYPFTMALGDKPKELTQWLTAWCAEVNVTVWFTCNEPLECLRFDRNPQVMPLMQPKNPSNVLCNLYPTQACRVAFTLPFPGHNLTYYD